MKWKKSATSQGDSFKCDINTPVTVRLYRNAANIHLPWTVVIGTRHYLSFRDVLMDWHVYLQPRFLFETFLANITDIL